MVMVVLEEQIAIMYSDDSEPVNDCKADDDDKVWLEKD